MLLNAFRRSSALAILPNGLVILFGAESYIVVGAIDVVSFGALLSGFIPGRHDSRHIRTAKAPTVPVFSMNRFSVDGVAGSSYSSPPSPSYHPRRDLCWVVALEDQAGASVDSAAQIIRIASLVRAYRSSVVLLR